MKTDDWIAGRGGKYSTASLSKKQTRADTKKDWAKLRTKGFTGGSAAPLLKKLVWEGGKFPRAWCRKVVGKETWHLWLKKK